MRKASALILTAQYGSGHLQVANVIANDLQEKGIKPIVSDLFGESYPAVSSITQSLLLKSFSYGPSFYKWFYEGTSKLNSKGLSQFSKYLGRKRLFELISIHQPLFVISTFPLHVAPFLIKKSKYSIPTYTVITDYCVHPFWLNPFISHYFVGSESVKNTLLKRKIKEKRITVSGIPIRPSFEEKVDVKAVYHKYALTAGRKVVTLLAGAQGILRNTKELCFYLLNNTNCLIIVICGNNKNLFEKLLPLTHAFPNKLKLMGYVENIHELLSISDALITKPGGITLTEAAALKVPLILYQPVPGQEAENAKYFKEQGAAQIVHTLQETIENVRLITQSEDFSSSMKLGFSSIHQRQAAASISNFVLSQALTSRKEAKVWTQPHMLL